MTVTVTLPGASPTTMESQITRKVEDAVASVPEIDDLVSTVNEGVSVTRIAFELGRDSTQALDKVKDTVDRIRSALSPRSPSPGHSSATARSSSSRPRCVSACSRCPACA